VRIKKADPKWVLLVELTVPPGEMVYWYPPVSGLNLHFANGEVLLGFQAVKPSTSRHTFGVVRLYRTIRGYARFITTPNVIVKPEWRDRTTAFLERN
jgi:hypothetical protein